MECSQMWIIDDKYSMPWTALQAQVEKPIDKYKAVSSSKNSIFSTKAEETKDDEESNDEESNDDDIIDENDFESEEEEEEESDKENTEESNDPLDS